MTCGTVSGVQMSCDDNRSSPRSRVLVVGPLPEPTHGASLVTAMIVDDLRRARIACRVIDTSATTKGGRLAYTCARLAIHLHATLLIVVGRYTSAYIGGAGGLGLCYQLMVVVACRLRRVNVVFHHHSSAYLTRWSVVMAAICRVDKRCRHIALTDAMSQTLRDRYSALDVVTISNAAAVRHWLDAAPYEPHDPAGTRAPSDPITIGHLSNLSVDKGLEDVYATYELVRAAQPGRFRMVVAGTTSHATDASVVQSARARLPEVSHVGRLDRAGVARFFQDVDVFLFPSRYANEAEPLVVLEALSRSVPVLSIAAGYVESVSHPPQWCFDTHSIFAVRASSVLTATCNSEIEQMGLQGRQAFGELAGQARARLTELYGTL